MMIGGGSLVILPMTTERGRSSSSEERATVLLDGEGERSLVVVGDVMDEGRGEEGIGVVS